jgi:hypothetical protein
LACILDLAWYAEFLLEIDLKILLRKTGARLNMKIKHLSLHISLGPQPPVKKVVICKSEFLFGNKIKI